MTFQSLLLWFLSIVGLFCALQAIVILTFAIKLSKRIDAITNRMELLQQRVVKTSETISRLLEVLRPFVRSAQEIEERSSRVLNQWLVCVRKTGVQIDDSLRLGRGKLRQFNAEVDAIFRRMQSTSAQVQGAILGPAAEIAAVIRGARRAWQRYTKKR
ncbi:MAG: hypothetical protein HY644_08015 [Acidobacteria bacterium]|nr:hypothetical protein [Acidobacteriota bacterium]